MSGPVIDDTAQQGIADTSTPPAADGRGYRRAHSAGTGRPPFIAPTMIRVKASPDMEREIVAPFCNRHLQATELNTRSSMPINATGYGLTFWPAHTTTTVCQTFL